MPEQPVSGWPADDAAQPLKLVPLMTRNGYAGMQGETWRFRHPGAALLQIASRGMRSTDLQDTGSYKVRRSNKLHIIVMLHSGI